jgi:hypothetical protein
MRLHSRPRSSCNTRMPLDRAPALQLAGAPPKAKLYATYEAARGLVAGNGRVAIDHAHTVAALERKLHLFLEPNVQHAARALPGLLTLLGGAYLTLHLPVTAGLLLWLYKRRPAAFARIRTTLLVASAFALIGFVLFPTVPPRLAGLGIADTVSAGHVNLNKGLVSSLYNPFAAVPSMHIGYALIVAAALVRLGNTRTVQLAGVVYPLLVLLVLVATGNHFFFDAAAGAIVVVAAYLAALAIGKRAPGAVTETSDRPAAVGCLPPASPGYHTASDRGRACRVNQAAAIGRPSTCRETRPLRLAHPAREQAQTNTRPVPASRPVGRTSPLPREPSHH